jgi:DNA-directed RNA polymerase subunit M/transcription elongation factor TFIIS
MDKDQPVAKTCPKCGSGQYMFRGRKKSEADPAKGEPESWETKYRCKTCGHKWKVRVARMEGQES